MFIFNRPFHAVAAGLAVALLIVWLDRLSEPPAAVTGEAPAANATPAACAAPAAWGIVRAGS
jgi:hypothetical protein